MGRPLHPATLSDPWASWFIGRMAYCGLSPADLAKQMGFGVRAIYHWRRATRHGGFPPRARVDRLAQVLCVPADLIRQRIAAGKIHRGLVVPPVAAPLPAGMPAGMGEGVHASDAGDAGAA